MTGTIDECLSNVFSESNAQLETKLSSNYNTVAGWRHQYQRQGLSVEKKREILSLYGYSLKTEEKWQKRKAR